MSEIVTQTAPPRLWLCVSDEPTDNASPFPKGLSDVTWAVDHCPVACGVGYIRSDLHNAELTRLRTALAESEAMRGRQMKTIDEMRGTIRVLGKECRATRLERERFFDKSSHAEWAESVRLAGEAIMSTNADPAARAAVEGA